MVSTLIEKPNKYMMKNVAISDTGMSISGRTAMRKSRKNRKMISTTRMNDTTRVS